MNILTLERKAVGRTEQETAGVSKGMVILKPRSASDVHKLTVCINNAKCAHQKAVEVLAGTAPGIGISVSGFKSIAPYLTSHSWVTITFYKYAQRSQPSKQKSSLKYFCTAATICVVSQPRMNTLFTIFSIQQTCK